MRKGNILIILVITIVVIGAGVYFYQKNKNDQVMMMKEKENEVMMKKASDAKAVKAKEGEKMPKEGSMKEKDKMMGKTTEYSGKLIAGKTAPFLEFKQEDYDKAVKEEKIVFLDFYANWCPICRAEKSEIESGFNSLTTDKVVGFRVNFNDSNTDAQEKELAKKFEVPYQHTKVILKNGKVILKSVDQWEKNTIVAEINKAVK